MAKTAKDTIICAQVQACFLFILNILINLQEIIRLQIGLIADNNAGGNRKGIREARIGIAIELLPNALADEHQTAFVLRLAAKHIVHIDRGISVVENITRFERHEERDPFDAFRDKRETAENALNGEMIVAEGLRFIDEPSAMGFVPNQFIEQIVVVIESLVLDVEAVGNQRTLADEDDGLITETLLAVDEIAREGNERNGKDDVGIKQRLFRGIKTLLEGLAYEIKELARVHAEFPRPMAMPVFPKGGCDRQSGLAGLNAAGNEMDMIYIHPLGLLDDEPNHENDDRDAGQTEEEQSRGFHGKKEGAFL